MADVKKCSKCTKTKPLSEFYKFDQMADGYRNDCKECVKARASKHSRDNPEMARIRSRRYKNANREKVRVSNKRYREENRGKLNEIQRLWRQEDKRRPSAHKKVAKALASGELVKGSCESCGSEDDVHAHHDDYGKPLNVTWLCSYCHSQLQRIEGN